MTNQEILKTVDHTNLKQGSTWGEIQKLCDDAVANQVASVCIPANRVAEAKSYVKDSLKICTVIGFPNGYSTTACKVYETVDAIVNGADEIDMVIPINWLKDGKSQEILKEINEIKTVCEGRILKVIIETCLLTEEEKIEMCKVVSGSNADFIKTSTGFSTNGATLEDIQLMHKHCSGETKIKAAGGISSFEDAKTFLSAGASRLGTSRLISGENSSY